CHRCGGPCCGGLAGPGGALRPRPARGGGSGCGRDVHAAGFPLAHDGESGGCVPALELCRVRKPCACLGHGGGGRGPTGLGGAALGAALAADRARACAACTGEGRTMKRALRLILLLAACREDEAEMPDPVAFNEETIAHFCQMNIAEHG